MISLITSAVSVVVVGIIICVLNVFAGLGVLIIGGLSVGKHFYTITNSMRAIKRVTSGELLTKQAMTKRM
jgi:hypothetical protein